MPHEMLELMQLLLTQTATEAQQIPAGPAVPTWGWITVVSVLGSTVGTIGALYKKARDKEVKAIQLVATTEASKVTLVQDVGREVSNLLERAIKAFTLNEANNEQVVRKFDELLGQIKELKEEVRRVGEKAN